LQSISGFIGAFCRKKLQNERLQFPTGIRLFSAAKRPHSFDGDNPISSTFSNLPDGGTITIGSSSFHANYEGRDGNDLTLTVVP